MRNRFFAGLAFFLLVGVAAFVVLTVSESLPMALTFTNGG